MFGKNAVAKPFVRADGTLRVNSIWYTIQGEGPDAGRPAIFIRLTGCNLRCYFCDTEFESGSERSLNEIMDLVTGLRVGPQCNLVVITGGEPFLQNIVPLVYRLNEIGFEVSVETAGSASVEYLSTVFAPDRSISGNLIVCSPKTPTLNLEVIPLIGALKYVIRHGEVDPDDGLPNRSTQVEGKEAKLFRTHSALTDGLPIYVQPMDEEPESMRRQNLLTAVESSMRHGYRLSIQMHKIAGLD